MKNKKNEEMFFDKLNNMVKDFNVDGIKVKKWEGEEIVTEDFISLGLKKRGCGEFYAEIYDDSVLNFKGCGILNLYLKKSCRVWFFFEDVDFSALSIRLFADEGVSVDLVEFTNSLFLYKSINVYAKSSSEIKLVEIVLNTKVNLANVFLMEDAKSQAESVFFGNGTEYYLRNGILNEGKNTLSYIKMKGAVINGARVRCDALIRVGERTSNCVGKEELRGLILDEGSFLVYNPILEINNENTLSSHSASVSNVDEKALFYMQSRGIIRERAIGMFVESLFDDFIFKLPKSEEKEKIFLKVQETFENSLFKVKN